MSKISWVLSPPLGLRYKEKVFLKRFIHVTLLDAADLLEVESNGARATFFSSLPRSNSIDPATLEGSGWIDLAKHDHKPLFALLYLNKRFREKFPALKADTDILKFHCTGIGSPFIYRRFSDLRKLYWEHETLRDDAEKLGLASKVIQLAKIETEIENCYF